MPMGVKFCCVEVQLWMSMELWKSNFSLCTFKSSTVVSTCSFHASRMAYIIENTGIWLFSLVEEFHSGDHSRMPWFNGFSLVGSWWTWLLLSLVDVGLLSCWSVCVWPHMCVFWCLSFVELFVPVSVVSALGWWFLILADGLAFGVLGAGVV